MKSRSYYVYILASRSGVLYIGVTNDIERRMSEHKAGHRGRFRREIQRQAARVFRGDRRYPRRNPA